MIFNNPLELISNTPMLKLNRLIQGYSLNIYLKLEYFNLSGSIKDRAALNIIERAEKQGILRQGFTIMEPSNGNMAISLALIGHLKGYRVVIIMPGGSDIEKVSMIKAYGGEIVFSDPALGMKGAIKKLEEIAPRTQNVFIPQQFANNFCSEVHYIKTAQEILNDVPEIDCFVAGVGTGGTITGVGRKLKETNPEIKVIAVEPSLSQVISGGPPGAHGIQGIGAGFVPKNLDRSVLDGLITVTDEDAINYTRILAREEGVLCGISTGANICAALRAASNGMFKNIVTIAADNGQKYLAQGLFQW